MFLLYYPLKQGLKLSRVAPEASSTVVFLLYYPLKQGLKPLAKSDCPSLCARVFTLLSIKTRIETFHRWYRKCAGNLFLSYYPLKQGLKLLLTLNYCHYGLYFYPTIH